MLKLSVNEEDAKVLISDQIKALLAEADYELVYWDAKELMRRTCMSWNFIQQQFFFDKRFPKKKIGSKWYFPAKETREFLIVWLNEQ